LPKSSAAPESSAARIPATATIAQRPLISSAYYSQAYLSGKYAKPKGSNPKSPGIDPSSHSGVSAFGYQVPYGLSAALTV
jgi:hypothetical protein